MRTRSIVLALLLATGAGWGESDPTAQDMSEAIAAARANSLLEAVNAVREVPLVMDELLVASAQYRAEELARTNIWSHQGPSGWPNKVARDHGYPLPEPGYPRPESWSDDANNIESIYIGGGSPERIVRAWLASPSHARHILGHYGFRLSTRVGIGHSGRIWVIHTAPPYAVMRPRLTSAA